MTSWYPPCFSYISKIELTTQINVQLNFPDLLVLLIVMATYRNHHTNLIQDDIFSLEQYGLHSQDVDQPVITTSLQLILHILVPSQLALLLLLEIWTNIHCMCTIRPFTNGSTTCHYDIMSIAMTTNHCPLHRYCTKAKNYSPPLNGWHYDILWCDHLILWILLSQPGMHRSSILPAPIKQKGQHHRYTSTTFVKVCAYNSIHRTKHIT